MKAKQTKSIHARMVDAEVRSANWLANGNEAKEKGNKLKAEQCYEKSTFWLIRANKLRNWPLKNL